MAAESADPGTRRELMKAIDAVEKENAALRVNPPANYLGIYPWSGSHGRLGKVLSRLRRGMGYPPFFAWHNYRWEVTGPWSAMIPGLDHTLDSILESGDRQTIELGRLHPSAGDPFRVYRIEFATRPP
jgi:hypothetical protein